MAIKKASEVATIDVVMVTIKKADNSGDEFIIETSSKVGVEPQIETTDAQKLIVKGRLIAQKSEESTMTGTKITLTDNVLTPELLKMIQGGTITYDAEVATKITGYTPPVVGSKDKGDVFTLCCYTAQYDEAGLVKQYEKIQYPNCKGSPVGLTVEDGAFRVMEYVINSAPSSGQAPYTLTYVAALPVPA